MQQESISKGNEAMHSFLGKKQEIMLSMKHAKTRIEMKLGAHINQKDLDKRRQNAWVNWENLNVIELVVKYKEIKKQ